MENFDEIIKTLPIKKRHTETFIKKENGYVRYYTTVTQTSKAPPRRYVHTPTGVYDSVASAADALGISNMTIYGRMKRFPKQWYFGEII